MMKQDVCGQCIYFTRGKAFSWCEQEAFDACCLDEACDSSFVRRKSWRTVLSDIRFEVGEWLYFRLGI